MWENRVLFIDGEAIVIDKPAGLAVHPGPSTSASLSDHLHQFRFGFQRLPQPVHRLDRDTSGCLLLARNPKAHKRFQQAFEGSEVRKTYLAILDGVPNGDDGVIDLPLAKISSREEGWRMVVEACGKQALTEWRVAAVSDGRALVCFSPRTGRTHQLRVHAATGLGIPIAGDPVYGSGTGPTLLHAWRLHLPRGTKPSIDAAAPLPDAFYAAGFTGAGLDDAGL
jgi:tRNA pseudouridine32 synthase / 23S rRNA pseudouridine746 synthase